MVDNAEHSQHEQHMGRRTVVALAGAAGVGAALGVGAPAAYGAPEEGEVVLRSEVLDVHVDRAFPRITGYTHRASGARLFGQAEPVTELRVDGKPYTPEVTSVVSADRVAYTLALPGGTELGVEIRAVGDQVRWRVTRIEDSGAGALKVGTLEFPGLAFLAVRSDQAGAVLYAARVELDKAKSGDTYVELTESSPTDPEPVGCAYAVVSTDGLAAAVETNTSYDKPADTKGASWDNGRLWQQVRADGAGRRTARVSCGQWTYRAATAAEGDTEPLPYATVVVTRDRNGDGRVDWQDAAIAMRDIMVVPQGADEQHLRVVPHIPFNFASQATNPFLATLDEVKRVSLATDGLRQFALLKGYQSEGHDSAHPDYAGNYNRRAGGLADLNTLLRAGKAWNVEFGVHVNCTESYPVANAFSEELVDEKNEQWDWLDQSYRIDQRRDLVSGDVVRRFRDLREETDGALNSLYIDVFRESGWTSDRLQRELRAQGWRVTTEWGHGFERSSVWSHWATETDYGPDSSRGINSRLIRFVRNHQKDVFVDKWPSLLGIPRTGNYEGWVGKTDWHAFYELIWSESLPAKYLQAWPVESWSEHGVAFSGGPGTSVSDAGGVRRITTDGRVVLDGGAYLLPWEPRKAADPEKLYHWNARGGRSSWRLPRGWEGVRSVTVYRLSPTGRAEPVVVPVRGGEVSLSARAKQPYVVFRVAQPAQGWPGWGEGTPVSDPGFLSGTLDAWRVQGRAEVRENALGDPELVVTGAGETAVSQRLGRLAPGGYVASVQVEVGAKAGERRRAELSVRTADGVTASNWTEVSTAVNYVAADRKHGSRFQRMFTYFTVPEAGGPVTLSLGAGSGAARVRFDNVRVVAARRPDVQGAVVREEFEHVPQGWGPFVKGDAGKANDPRTHIAQRHAPFTQRGWNGKAVDDVLEGSESLKSRGENAGLVYRTVSHSVRFRPGQRYEVRFRYVNEAAGQYAWVTAVDDPEARELERTALPVAHDLAEHRYEFTAPAEGEAWVGLRKTGDDGKAEFVLDSFTVTEVDR